MAFYKKRIDEKIEQTARSGEPANPTPTTTTLMTATLMTPFTSRKYLSEIAGENVQKGRYGKTHKKLHQN